MRKIRLTEVQKRIIDVLRENESKTEMFKHFIQVNEGVVDDMWVRLSDMRLSDIMEGDGLLSEWLDRLDVMDDGIHNILAHKEGVLADVSATSGEDAMMRVDVYIDNMFTTLNKKVRVMRELLVKMTSFSDGEVLSVFSGVRVGG